MANTHNRAGLRGFAPAAGSSAAAELDHLKVEALKYGLLGLVGAVGVGGFFLTRNALRATHQQAQKEKVQEQAAVADSDANLADLFRVAFNPSGYEWSRSLDGTDVTGVMNVLRRIRTQAQVTKVAGAYFLLTRRHLYNDLADELSATEYQDFRLAVRKKPLK